MKTVLVNTDTSLVARNNGWKKNFSEKCFWTLHLRIHGCGPEGVSYGRGWLRVFKICVGEKCNFCRLSNMELRRWSRVLKFQSQILSWQTNSSSYVHVLHKTSHGKISCDSRIRKAKKSTGECDTQAELQSTFALSPHCAIVRKYWQNKNGI